MFGGIGQLQKLTILVIPRAREVVMTRIYGFTREGAIDPEDGQQPPYNSSITSSTPSWIHSGNTSTVRWREV
jgi:phenylalanine-4-hydroxylase